MLRTLLVFLGALAAMSSASAFRVLEQTESSFELDLAKVRLPSGITGSVTFTTCDTCPTASRPLTTSTKYYVDGREVAYADFLTVAEDLRATVDGPVLLALFVNNESQRVTHLRIHTPAPDAAAG